MGQSQLRCLRCLGIRTPLLLQPARRIKTARDTLALVNYLAEEDKMEKVLENQQLLKTPVVRNGKLATVGYRPDIWKTWS